MANNGKFSSKYEMLFVKFSKWCVFQDNYESSEVKSGSKVISKKNYKI